MRVAVYYNNRDIRLKDYPVPSIGPGEILVKVVASGICGTDLMEWYRIKKAPRILGHEIAGKIVESKSERHKVGERVFVSHHVPCLTCKYCLAGNQTACATLHQGNYDPGGYSEFVRVPQINVDYGVYPLAPHVSYEEGTVIEPLACAIRGQELMNIQKGQTVLVMGCGVSGLLNIRLAKQKQATVVATDINLFRLKMAKIYGADEAFDARQTLGIKPERIIVCTGASQAASQALSLIDKKGIILFFAIPQDDIMIPTADFWRNEITVTSSYGAAPGDLEKALMMIEKGEFNVKDLISHRLPLARIEEGFRLAAQAGECLKIVLMLE